MCVCSSMSECILDARGGDSQRIVDMPDNGVKNASKC